MKIYIASWWKNVHAIEMLTALLRERGHEVKSWVEQNYGEGYGAPKPMNFDDWVNTESAQKSFDFDTSGAAECDLLIYLGPAGKDAVAECGIAYGNKRRMVVYMQKAKTLVL